MLENSLREVLRAHGHDVTKFDYGTQTQQDLTILALFEQMRGELEKIFGTATVADIDRVFLAKGGPAIRHSVAHGLMHAVRQRFDLRLLVDLQAVLSSTLSAPRRD